MIRTFDSHLEQFFTNYHSLSATTRHDFSLHRLSLAYEEMHLRSISMFGVNASIMLYAIL